MDWSELDRQRLLRMKDGSAIDYFDVPLSQILSQTKDLNVASKQARNERITSFVATIAPNESYETAFSKLERLAEHLEAEIAERLRPHSVLFWLTMYRELLRSNAIGGFNDPLDYVSQNRYMELAVAKYASYDPWDIFEGDNLWLIQPSESDVRGMLDACCIAGLGSACRRDLRRVAMGADLTIVNGDWRTVLKEPAHTLAEIYAARLRMHANLFSHAGVSGASELPQGRGRWWIELAGKNEGDTVWSGSAKAYVGEKNENTGMYVDEDECYRPTFRLGEFTLDQKLGWLYLIEKDISERAGFPLEAALLILRALAIFGAERHDTYRLGHRLRSVAFLVMSEREILERAQQERAASDVQGVQDSDLAAALSFLSRTSSNRANILLGSMFDLRSLTRLDSGHVIVDYLTTFSGVRHLFDLLATAENVEAEQRATALEYAVAEWICSSVPQARPWGVNQDLRFVDGAARQVDVAVVVGNALLVCECKSFARRPADVIPHRARINRQWAKVVKALQQVDTLCQKFASTAVRGPGPLPQDVRYIVPCVVTPTAEWIPDPDTRYWFGPDLPRVCTVEEAAFVARVIATGATPPNAIPVRV